MKTDKRKFGTLPDGFKPNAWRGAFWSLLLLGSAAVVVNGIRHDREVSRWTAEAARLQERLRQTVTYLGNPYKLMMPFVRKCEGLDYSTANCARWDYDRDGDVDRDDEVLILSAAQRSIDAWANLMAGRASPESTAEEFARQAEAMEP